MSFIYLFTFFAPGVPGKKIKQWGEYLEAPWNAASGISAATILRCIICFGPWLCFFWEEVFLIYEF